MKTKSTVPATGIEAISPGWTTVAVGNLVRFSSGQGISVAALHKRSTDYPVPVYGGNGIAGYTDRSITQERTVVIGRVGQRCGEVHLTAGPAWVTDNALLPVRFLRDLDVGFLALALRAARLNDVKNRNDLPLVTQSILHAVRIPWPPNISEQRAIAAAISDVDALIASLDRVIAKKRDLRQAAMQQLLTGQTRLPGFDGKWQRLPLGALGTFSKGKGIRKDDVREDGCPCLRYGEIYTHHSDVIRSFRSFISRDVAKTSKRLNTGDLIFAGSGETAEEIGKCVAFVGREEAYVGGDTVILSPRGQDSVFLGYLLNHAAVVEQKARRGQGDAVVHISARNLASIVVSFPELGEQRAVGAVLADMDSELSALSARRDKTRLLKQGMMQELLTGRTRLV